MSKPQIDVQFIRQCAARSLESQGFLFADPENHRLGHTGQKSLPEEAKKYPVFQKGKLFYINPSYVLKLQDWQVESLFLDILSDKN